MWAAILAILKIVPELITLAKESFRLWQLARKEGWVAEGKELARQLREAKDDVARKALLRKISEHESAAP